MSNTQPKVALLFQANPPPRVGQTKKPMKPGGYKDSGADIAFALKQKNMAVITPKSEPVPGDDYDWVFPDTNEGIQAALDKGANVLWLNTILYRQHPIEKFFGRGLEFVGQTPEITDFADDKFVTNERLRKAGLTVATSELIQQVNNPDLNFPVVLKPVRGRGSQGVVVVDSSAELNNKLLALQNSQEYGIEFILEEMLPGKEITITVMPPGESAGYWALPPALRFNHHEGIAPYNGTVPVTENSRALTVEEMQKPEVSRITQECEEAARILEAKAPIRVDCRQAQDGTYKIFDLNVKPNMTGAGRPGRETQDCLCAISARAMGWSYADLLLAMLNARWQR